MITLRMFVQLLRSEQARTAFAEKSNRRYIHLIWLLGRLTTYVYVVTKIETKTLLSLLDNPKLPLEVPPEPLHPELQVTYLKLESEIRIALSEIAEKKAVAYKLAQEAEKKRVAELRANSPPLAHLNDDGTPATIH